MSRANKAWDKDYEWKAVTLLGIGFGLVGLDRWIIAPLFPCMAATGVMPGCGAPGLGLDYQAIGNLVGILGLVWGVFAAVSGRPGAECAPQHGPDRHPDSSRDRDPGRRAVAHGDPGTRHLGHQQAPRR